MNEIERLRENLNNLLRLTANNEQLRRLLQGAVQIDQGDFRFNVDEWMTRIREALGDE